VRDFLSETKTFGFRFGAAGGSEFMLEVRAAGAFLDRFDLAS
jgi:hypothetical protein